MSLRKGIILVFLSILSLPLFSQASTGTNMVMADYQPFHFGYSLGVNMTGFDVVPFDKSQYQVELVTDTTKATPGLNPGLSISLITDYRLSKYLNLRFIPGITGFSQRNLRIENNTTGEFKTFPIESIFVDLPILLKYRSLRVRNHAPYFIAGINPRFDLIGSKIEGFKPGTRIIKSFDIYPELGVGIDIYLATVKVAMELKFSVGLNNIKVTDINSDKDKAQFQLFEKGVSAIYSRILTLSFNVEQSQ